MDKVIFRTPLHTVYLSFPISKPRELLEDDGVEDGIKEINNILREVSEFETKEENVNFVFFCPLTIDEYPLLKIKGTKKGKNEYGEDIRMKVFKTKNRWNVRDFYGEDAILLNNGITLPKKIAIPENYIGDVEGMIHTDVGIRDYCLIEQSMSMAVFDPIFKNSSKKIREEGELEYDLSGGVFNEIEYALTSSSKDKEILLYQNKNYDPNNLVRKKILTGSSTVVGDTAERDRVTPYNTVRELLEDLHS